MLRKVFIKEGVVVSVCQVGMPEATITCSLTDVFVFVSDASIDVKEGYGYTNVEGVDTFIPVPVTATGCPSFVKMKQARLALLAAGHLSAVKTAIATMSEEVQIEWEFSETVERSSPLVTAIAALLPLTNVEVDNLFINASTITATIL